MPVHAFGERAFLLITTWKVVLREEIEKSAFQEVLLGSDPVRVELFLPDSESWSAGKSSEAESSQTPSLWKWGAGFEGQITGRMDTNTDTK